VAKEKKVKKSPLKSTAYKIENGKLVRTKLSCPKCGSAVFLAEHKDRYHCGRCGYSRWKK